MGAEAGAGQLRCICQAGAQSPGWGFPEGPLLAQGPSSYLDQKQRAEKDTHFPIRKEKLHPMADGPPFLFLFPAPVSFSAFSDGLLKLLGISTAFSAARMGPTAFKCSQVIVIVPTGKYLSKYSPATARFSSVLAL